MQVMSYDEIDLSFEDFASSVHISKVDDYLEMLYSQDDFLTKVKASFIFMQLSRNPDNLEFIIINETLLNALGRELKEEGKKSMDLTLNILYVFFSLSHFSQFHQVITKFKIGGTIIKVIRYEERRYEDLIYRKKQSSTSSQASNQNKKIDKMIEKQERLLFAEDINLEIKMKKKNVISSLVKCLDRRSIDLLLLVVKFLKKLSIFEENKSEIVSVQDVLLKLNNLLTLSHVSLKDNTIRLLFNLSFDHKVRYEMLSTPGLVQNCVEQLKEASTIEPTLKLLYHLSCNEKGRMLLTEASNLTVFILDYVANFSSSRIERVVIALMVNLIPSLKNAIIVIKKLNIVEFIYKHLQQALKVVKENSKSLSGNNVCLEAICFVGAVTCDNECAKIISSTPIVQMITQLFIDAVYDNEFLLQILNTFCKFMYFEPTLRVFLQQKNLLLDDRRGLTSLILHNSEEVRRLVHLIFDMAIESESNWKEQVRKYRFCMYNKEWCRMIEEEKDMV